MPAGIGASGICGLAIEELNPPVQSATVPSGTGGTLAAGTYRYYITALNANGETTISNEQTATTTGTTSSVDVNWTAVTGATGYKIYRTGVDGAAGTQLLLTQVGLVTTYKDIGDLTPAGAFPTTNTALSPGVYTPPTKFFPFVSESLVTSQETIWRRPIRQSADILGAVPGNFHMEGDMSIEALEDVVLYFLAASRTSIIKSGVDPDFTYVITPTSLGVANKTLSITIVRNGIVFGYTGVTTSSFTFNISDGLLMFDVSLMGRDEATQTAPVPTWTTSEPFGAGMYSIEFPTGNPVTDTDTFEWTVEDNAEPQFRLKNSGRGADFIKYGERNATISAERDFTDRTDYDAFKALTAQSVTITAERGPNNSISLLAPVAIKDSYEVTAPGQGDLVRASVSYQNVMDATGKSWEITIKTQEDYTP